jgi:hypothetical protein
VSQPAVASFGALPGAEHAAEFIQAISDMRRAYASALLHLAEMGHAQTAQVAGYTSQAAFVAELVHINRQKASRMVAQAEQVTLSVTPTGHTAPAKLPTLRTALLDGVIDGEHIDAVADAIKQLPDWATLEHRELVETTLGETARTHSSSVVREHGLVLLNRINSDGTNPLLEDHEAEPANTFRYKLLPTGRIKYSGEADTETAEELLALFGPLAKPTPPAPGVPDPRPIEQRQGDAFAAVVHLAVTAGDAPVHGGIKPHLNVILDHTILTKGLGTATLDCGTAINAHAIRTLACDANLIPMVLNTEGVPLDVGREHRQVTKEQRTALVARDRGCAFPGCHLPARWTDAHHIHHWMDGGRTDLANMVLLCRRHHRIVHGTEWSIQVVDGIPYFKPPKWVDYEQKLLRNVLRH